MKSLVFALMALFLVSGCAGVFDDPAMDAEASLAIACNEYALAIESAVPFAATMNEDQKSAFRTTMMVVGPICLGGLTSDANFDFEGALAQVNAMLAKMLLMQSQLESM